MVAGINKTTTTRTRMIKNKTEELISNIVWMEFHRLSLNIARETIREPFVCPYNIVHHYWLKWDEYVRDN